MNRNSRVALRCSLAAGALLGVGPAFGANLPKFDLTFTPPDYVLGALLLVLIVALAVSLSRDHRRRTETARGEPDMRWWKNAHS